MDAALEARLREIADRDAIWQVMLRYARGLDRMDAKLARSCYWDDAVEDHGRFIGGPDGFIAWVERVSALYRWTQHSLTNFTCELAGEEAHAETYFLFMGVSERAPHFLSSGRYIDHFRRRGDEWRIANRVTLVEGTFDLPDASVVTDLPPAYGPGEAYPGTRDRSDASYHRPVRPRLRRD